jgi:hypothetical protein
MNDPFPQFPVWEIPAGTPCRLTLEQYAALVEQGRRLLTEGQLEEIRQRKILAAPTVRFVVRDEPQRRASGDVL